MLVDEGLVKATTTLTAACLSHLITLNLARLIIASASDRARISRSYFFLDDSEVAIWQDY